MKFSLFMVSMCAETIFLTVFVGSNQQYSERRSFPTRFRKVAFLFLTLLVPPTSLQGLNFLNRVIGDIFDVCGVYMCCNNISDRVRGL